MAIGDLLIRRNASDSSTTISTSNTTLVWDTEEEVTGSEISYSSGVFTLASAGVYLVIWNEDFYTADTDSLRIDIQGELVLDGTTALMEGRAHGYLRKDATAGNQSIVLRGVGIIRTTSSNQTVEVRVYRSDTGAGNDPARRTGRGGVQIIRLDESDNFGRYSGTSTQSLTVDTAVDVVLGSSDEEDSPFTRSSNSIDIDTDGRYLVAYSMDLTTSGGDRTEVSMFLTLNGTEVPGSRKQCYIRELIEHDAAMSHLCLIDVSAGDDLVWRVARTEGGTTTISSGAAIQIWQLPSGNKVAVMEATTGDMNALGDFAFDTLPIIDTDRFTATAGNDNIDVDQSSDYLVIGNLGRSSYWATASRPTPYVAIEADGTTVPYGFDSTYSRADLTAGHPAMGAIAIVKGFGSGSLRVTIPERGGSTSASVDCETAQFAVIDLGTIFAAPPTTAIRDVIGGGIIPAPR